MAREHRTSCSKRGDVEFLLSSILNEDLVDDLMSRADACFQLAAAAGLQLIVDKPLESLATNIRDSEMARRLND